MIKTTRTRSKDDPLGRMLQRLKDPSSAMAEIGKALVQSTRTRIKSTKTDPDESPWAPWADSTRIARTKDNTASKGLLYKTGELSRSIQAQVTNKQAIVGSDSPYASFLQLGTSDMPARPFIGISQKDKAVINNILLKHLKS